MTALSVGLRGQMQAAVDERHAIGFLGDPGARVLSTPALIMYLEMTSRDLVKPHLEPGHDTVGTHVDVRHLAATPLGMSATYHSELIEINGRRLRFRVEAYDEKEKIGEGFHERAIIDISRFAGRVQSKRKE